MFPLTRNISTTVISVPTVVSPEALFQNAFYISLMPVLSLPVTHTILQTREYVNVRNCHYSNGGYDTFASKYLLYLQRRSESFVFMKSGKVKVSCFPAGYLFFLYKLALTL